VTDSGHQFNNDLQMNPAISKRFDEAASPAGKLQVMVEMERLSFDEFRNFLCSNNEARFVV
jgi:hypothetical protein